MLRRQAHDDGVYRCHSTAPQEAGMSHDDQQQQDTLCEQCSFAISILSPFLDALSPCCWQRAHFILHQLHETML
jgi:hypothetical protein